MDHIGLDVGPNLSADCYPRVAGAVQFNTFKPHSDDMTRCVANILINRDFIPMDSFKLQLMFARLELRGLVK